MVLDGGQRAGRLPRGDRGGGPAGAAERGPHQGGPALQLVREPDLGIVLFRRVGWTPADYDAGAAGLHRDEVAFVPPSRWDGETVGRLTFLHPGTSIDLVREVLARTE